MAPRVWIIEFKEEASPTLIQGRAGANLFSHGRVWIEASSGRLMKSEMSIDQPELRCPTSGPLCGSPFDLHALGIIEELIKADRPGDSSADS